MKTRTLYDKTSWARGSWDRETDLAWWICETTSYCCVAERNPFGAWCGFVGVDWDHELFEVSIGSEILEFVEVHLGDITYGSFNDEYDRLFQPTTKRFYFGFDCMQELDICPAFKEEIRDAKRLRKTKSVAFHQIPQYRNFQYVLAEIQKLTAQLQCFDDRQYDEVKKLKVIDK